jgi:hypothetical protein
MLRLCHNFYGIFLKEGFIRSSKMADFNPDAEAYNLSDMFGAQSYLDFKGSNENRLLDEINAEYCGLTPDQRAQTIDAIRRVGVHVDSDGFGVVAGLTANGNSYASLRCEKK